MTFEERQTAMLLAELDAALPNRVARDALTVQAYRRDEAVTVDAGMPVAVAFPSSTEEVQGLVRIAAEHAVTLVPRGAGSGLVGGAAASDGSIVVSLERMNRLIMLDTENLYAIVEPGLINAELAAAASDEGLFYAPDPASRDVSTLGGNVATNAGGLCCVKYGVTRDSVLGLEVVLADATVLRLGRRTLKGVAGYDLTSLFVGSEGTLGIITRATLRLRPKPRPAATFVAFFPTLAAAGQAAAGIRRRVTPSLLELLDRFVLASVEEWRHLGLDTTSAAMLIGQSDSGGDEGHREVMSMRDCCELAGASFTAETTDALETDVFLAARKLALPSLGRRGLTLLDDVAVPCARVPDLIEAIETIAQRLGLSIAIYGHIGDGNMHPTIVLERDTTEMRHRAAQAFEGIARAALSLGGTIAGEHGTGLLKRDLLREELGDPLLELQRRLKAVFDPQNIMNAGKLA